MRVVQLESPYRGGDEAETAENVAYARRCLHDSLARGEAPFASHLLYTQCLDDTDPDERQWGIDAGLAFLAGAEATVVYVDRGVSSGMAYGIAAAEAVGVPVEYRSLEAS